jgi:hypothetical protein
MWAIARPAALVAAALAIYSSLSLPATGDSQAASVPPTAQSGPRLIYPANDLPTLVLPDGQKKLVRSMLNVPRAFHYGEYAWDDKYIPPGPTWVRIDLDRQTLSVFRGGHEIGATVILYGTDGKPTPTGVFPILERAKQHRSTLYSAEMPYMLRLTNDGVAIHASNVRRGAATHGCIGIPASFARLLFDQVKRGDLVSIQRDASFRKASAPRSS